jgi:hypothetical protein
MSKPQGMIQKFKILTLRRFMVMKSWAAGSILSKLLLPDRAGTFREIIDYAPNGDIFARQYCLVRISLVWNQNKENLLAYR